LRPSDHDQVARLLGRPPAGPFVVAMRRRDGTPAVIENAPLLDDGRPMPTLYWLVDPELREAVSRVEAAGGVRQAGEAVAADRVANAHERYAARRDSLLPVDHRGPSPSGGVGGTRRGVKCLHAHLAWWLAGGDDPVGQWTAEQLPQTVDDLRASFVPGEGPVAAVDCGTNSTRLIVVDQSGVALERHMRITRLGEGVDATRRLSHDAIERTLAVLRDYRAVMDARAVVRTRVVATSAARDAANASEFMVAAEEILGVRPEVLPGAEEGRLSFLGATAKLGDVEVGEGPVLVVDIGGGSTELSVGHPPRTHDSVVQRSGAPATRSLDVGCVRVSERYLRHDPPRAEELDAARRALDEELSSARSELPPLSGDSLLIGLAGTVSTVTALAHGFSTYDRALVHHSWVDRAEVDRWLKILGSEDSNARLEHEGMVEGREDVIVGGLLVLSVVMAVFGRERCLVSEDDILDGLAADLLG